MKKFIFGCILMVSGLFGGIGWCIAKCISQTAKLPSVLYAIFVNWILSFIDQAQSGWYERLESISQILFYADILVLLLFLALTVYGAVIAIKEIKADK